MEEWMELRHCIEEQRYGDALMIVDEPEAMSRDDKIQRISAVPLSCCLI